MLNSFYWVTFWIFEEWRIIVFNLYTLFCNSKKNEDWHPHTVTMSGRFFNIWRANMQSLFKFLCLNERKNLWQYNQKTNRTRSSWFLVFKTKRSVFNNVFDLCRSFNRLVLWFDQWHGDEVQIKSKFIFITQCETSQAVDCSKFAQNCTFNFPYVSQ